MNSLVAVFTTTIFFLAVGWNITKIFPISSIPEKYGLSFILGAGLSTFTWFVGYMLGLPFNLYTLAFVGLIVSGVGNILAKKYGKNSIKISAQANTKSDKIIIFTIIAILGIAFLIGSHNVLSAWDSIALYDFRGHSIAINHSLKDITDSSYYVSYPLMISLVHSIVYMLGGLSAQGIHAVMLMAFSTIIYGRVREWTYHSLALITVLAVITQNQVFYHSTFAYTNLPYTTYLVSGLAYLASVNNKKINYLVLSGLIIGLSTWVRSSETFWIIGVVLIVFQGYLYKRNIIAFLSVLIILGIKFTWSLYFHAILVSINYTFEQTLSSFGTKNVLKIISNWREIYWYIRLNIIDPYRGIWFMSIPISVITIAKKDKRLAVLLSAILMSGGMVIAGTMIFSTFYVTWNEIGDSARRMMLFIIPLTIITSIYALDVITRDKKNEK